MHIMYIIMMLLCVSYSYHCCGTGREGREERGERERGERERGGEGREGEREGEREVK